MYKYKVVTTKHLQPRKYYYAYNATKNKWVRITSYDFTLATIDKDCAIEKVSDSEIIYTVYDEGVALTQSEPSESVATPSEATVATDNTQYELPFIGFCQSVHCDRPHEEMEYTLYEKCEPLTDEQYDNLWAIFHKGFDYNGYRQKVAELYAHWLVHQLDQKAVFTTVELHSQKENNFTTDTITVTLDYFTENGLMYETLAVIKERYTSKDGFVSVVNPIPPTLNSVFTEPAYIDCAFEVLVYHTLKEDYNLSYSDLRADLDTAFMDYMFEQGWYADLTWEFMPKELVQFFDDLYNQNISK